MLFLGQKSHFWVWEVIFESSFHILAHPSTPKFLCLYVGKMIGFLYAKYKKWGPINLFLRKILVKFCSKKSTKSIPAASHVTFEVSYIWWLNVLTYDNFWVYNQKISQTPLTTLIMIVVPYWECKPRWRPHKCFK